MEFSEEAERKWIPGFGVVYSSAWLSRGTGSPASLLRAGGDSGDPEGAPLGKGHGIAMATSQRLPGGPPLLLPPAALLC